MTIDVFYLNGKRAVHDHGNSAPDFIPLNPNSEVEMADVAQTASLRYAAQRNCSNPTSEFGFKSNAFREINPPP